MIRDVTDPFRETCGPVLLIEKDGTATPAEWNGKEWAGLDGALYAQMDHDPHRYHSFVGFVSVMLVSELLKFSDRIQRDILNG